VYETVALVGDHENPYDAQILKKIRGLYDSCLNEDLLDARGTEPLLHVIRTVRKLFNGESTNIEGSESVQTRADEDDKEKQRKGFTAALAYLHSRGMTCLSTAFIHLPILVFFTGIDALFDVDVDGDVGKDPNLMTLWFSQPSLGLPSKVLDLA
jgi:endothelin-converting enzyme